MIPATDARIVSNQVDAVGKELFAYFARHVDPVIQAAAEQGHRSANLVQVTAANPNIATISGQLEQLGYTVSRSPGASPSAQHLVVSW